ncbi:CoA transferase [Mycobacterium sp. ACS4331]|uniref:CoA transferase n=1 Tax=Mycobacterium sp. ACS4331 TaxID=1834121 RepID=UPI0007FD31C3|nr:CoA transferase [Mycobacterium sp. ACS4331]OBF29168.1 acyl-CoA transferase [Mycobacterium sp. ACS4331]
MGSLGITDSVLSRAQAVADDLSAHADGLSRRVDAWELLSGRAALLDLAPRGRVSAGGATRLLRTVDGWTALTLSRDDDLAAVPALLESDAAADDPWPAIELWAAARPTGEVVERGVLLGLPVAALGEVEAASPRVIGCGTAGPTRPPADLLVVDLSSMWAGPLCGQLLAQAGAVVVKVESPGRPDGTRLGPRRFFDWMNGGKLCYAVDFDRDREALSRLLQAADVVLEGSRPDALARRGLGPHDLPPLPGRVWLRVTGYGTDVAGRDRVAFGDDAAVAGGLVGRGADSPVFIGDAIADPLTGLTAAHAVLDAVRRGGGLLVEVAMSAVAATYAADPRGAVVGAPAAAPATIPSAAAELGAQQAEVESLVAQRIGPSC